MAPRETLEHREVEGPRAILVVERLKHGGMSLGAQRRAEPGRNGHGAATPATMSATTTVSATAFAARPGFQKLHESLLS